MPSKLSAFITQNALHRENCTIVNEGEHKIKDLSKLRPRPLESIVILDDNPMSSKLQVNELKRNFS